MCKGGGGGWSQRSSCREWGLGEQTDIGVAGADRQVRHVGEGRVYEFNPNRPPPDILTCSMEAAGVGGAGGGGRVRHRRPWDV